MARTYKRDRAGRFKGGGTKVSSRGGGFGAKVKRVVKSPKTKAIATAALFVAAEIAVTAGPSMVLRQQQTNMSNARTRNQGMANRAAKLGPGMLRPKVGRGGRVKVTTLSGKRLR